VGTAAHITALRTSAQSWNEWRQEEHIRRPDLRNARLVQMDLSSYDLHDALLDGAHIHECSLYRANCRGLSLCDAELERVYANSSAFQNARLAGTSLSDVDFSFAMLDSVSFQRSFLEAVVFRQTSLINADFTEATIDSSHFDSATLEDATFTNARLSGAAFSHLSLRDVHGLSSIRFASPSSIGVDTFFISGGLPPNFLAGCGSPQSFLKYAQSLAGVAVDYYSCFLSFSSQDESFARRLYADLQEFGIRTWLAPEYIKIGERFRARIDSGIQTQEKLVIILSEYSIDSPWVETEVETAFARERNEKRDVLFPIRVDDAVFRTSKAWALEIIRTRQVGDFRDWKQPKEYTAAVRRLVRDLRRDESAIMMR